MIPAPMPEIVVLVSVTLRATAAETSLIFSTSPAVMSARVTLLAMLSMLPPPMLIVSMPSPESISSGIAAARPLTLIVSLAPPASILMDVIDAARKVLVNAARSPPPRKSLLTSMVADAGPTACQRDRIDTGRSAAAQCELRAGEEGVIGRGQQQSRLERIESGRAN